MFAALIDEIKITGLSFEKKMGQLQQETNSIHLFDFFGALVHASRSEQNALFILQFQADLMNDNLRSKTLELKRDWAKRWFPHFLFCFFFVFPLIFMTSFVFTHIEAFTDPDVQVTHCGLPPARELRQNSYSFHLGYSQQPTLENSLYFEPAVVAKRY